MRQTSPVTQNAGTLCVSDLHRVDCQIGDLGSGIYAMLGRSPLVSAYDYPKHSATELIFITDLPSPNPLRNGSRIQPRERNRGDCLSHARSYARDQEPG
jgi:hypothetical protein